MIRKLGVKIKKILLKIIEEAKKCDLARHGWKVHWPLVEERKSLNCYTFIDRFDIKKKVSSFYPLANDLKEHLKIKNYNLTNKRIEEKFIVTIYCKE